MQGVPDAWATGLDLKTLEMFGHGTTVTEVGESAMRDTAGRPIDHGKHVVDWRHDPGLRPASPPRTFRVAVHRWW